MEATTFQALLYKNEIDHTRHKEFGDYITYNKVTCLNFM